MLGTEPSSRQEQQALLTTDPPLWTQLLYELTKLQSHDDNLEQTIPEKRKGDLSHFNEVFLR